MASQSHAQQLARRLILKDGSYQLVTNYEVKGDRVRYKSAERDEWEELPSALVDWPATEKYEKDRATSAIPEAARIDKEVDADREAELARLPQVAPGLRLPDYSGVFLLDNFHGQPQLVELQQSEGDINREHQGKHPARSHSHGRRQADRRTRRRTRRRARPRRRALDLHQCRGRLCCNRPAAKPRPHNCPSPASTLPAPSSKVPSDKARSNRSSPSKPLVPFDRFHIVHTKVKSGKRIVGDTEARAQRQDQSGPEFREDHHRPRKRRLAQTNSHRRPGPWRVRR